MNETVRSLWLAAHRTAHSTTDENVALLKVELDRTADWVAKAKLRGWLIGSTSLVAQDHFLPYQNELSRDKMQVFVDHGARVTEVWDEAD